MRCSAGRLKLAQIFVDAVNNCYTMQYRNISKPHSSLFGNYFVPSRTNLPAGWSKPFTMTIATTATLAQPTAPGRPKDLAKRAAILQAAKTLFLKLGYDGTSMDAIAAEAGVSKLTVYSHFNDKESLFSAAIEGHCANRLPPLCFDLALEAPIEQALYTVACRFQDMLNDAEAIDLHRLMVGMAAQNPALTLLFFNAGPQRAINEMARLLQQAHDQRKLDIPDVTMAAEYFLSSFSGCTHFRRILGIDTQSDAAASAAYAREIVQRFLRSYRVGA